MNKFYIPSNAQFIDTFFPTIDGVVRTVHNYADSMNAMGACSCVVAPNISDSYEDDFPYEVFRCKSLQLPLNEYRLAAPSLTPGLSDYLERGGFQLFHVHSPFTVGHYALRQARRLGIPVVATFHSKYYDDVLNVTHSPAAAREMTKYIVKFYENADSVWAVSRGTADTLRGYGYSGDIFIVDNGTDYAYPAQPELLRRRAMEQFTIPAGKPVILFVGHQIWQKNLRLVLDTAAELKLRGLDYQMLIVGDGYCAESIKAYAASLELGESVRFLGQVSDMELMKGLYLSSSLFFFPSMYDNAPLVLREASAMGVPSLLLRGSNAAEKVRDGYNGYLTDNSSDTAARRICAVLADPEGLHKTGAAARSTISRPWNEIIPRVAEKYREVTRLSVAVS